MKKYFITFNDLDGECLTKSVGANSFDEAFEVCFDKYTPDFIKDYLNYKNDKSGIDVIEIYEGISSYPNFSITEYLDKAEESGDHNPETVGYLIDRIYISLYPEYNNLFKSVENHFEKIKKRREFYESIRNLEEKIEKGIDEILRNELGISTLLYTYGDSKKYNVYVDLENETIVKLEG